MTVYIDAHCHLDQYQDPMKTLAEAPNTVVIAVSETPSSYRLLSARFRHDPRIRVALGLHPLRAATAGPLEQGMLTRYLDDVDYVGEVGLDFSKHGRESKAAQLRIFDRLLEEPVLRRKVITLHSRGAERIVIERLHDAAVTGILHWFTGARSLLEPALAAGLYFSINPSMLRTDKGRAIIASLPPERVLTESDGPYAKSFGNPLAPVDMPALVFALAQRWNTDTEDARRIVHDNLARLHATTVGMQ